MDTKNLAYKNSNIHYSKTGSGIPVVLLHGFAEDSSIWDGIADSPGNDFELLIPDLPGSGNSGLLTQEKANLYDFAGMIHSML